MLSFTQMPDESLMDFIKAGDKRAFETLVVRHQERFYRMAYRWLLHEQDAQDVVQQAFVKLWSGQARWKAGKKAKFTTWFYTILYNQSVDLLRKKSRQFAPLNEAIAAADDDQERETIASQTQAQLQDALRTLPDQQRIAVQLFYFEALKQKEIAAMMGLSVKALESQLTRAKQNLRAALGDLQPLEQHYG